MTEQAQKFVAEGRALKGLRDQMGNFAIVGFRHAQQGGWRRGTGVADAPWRMCRCCASVPPWLP